MKNKSIRAIAVLAVLNIIVFGLYGIVHMSNIKSASADTNLYVSEKTTGEIVSIKAEGRDFAFEINLTDGSWILSGNESFPISGELIDKLIEKANNLTAARMIDDNGDYAKYGLENPAQKLTLTDSDGVSVTYRIGDFNENINRYYVCEDGGKKIFIINKSIGEQLSEDIYSYAASYDLSALSKSTLNYVQCVTAENAVYIAKADKDNDNPMGSSSIWRFREPFTSDTFADANKIDSFILKLKNAASSPCVSFSPDNEERENYGIENSSIYFNVNYTNDGVTSDAIMRIGKINDDGSAYISFDKTDIIGLADSETVKSLLEYTDSYKFLPQSICTVKKDKVKSMDVTSGAKEYHFEFTDTGYTINGAECSSESFEAFFNKLSGIVSSSHSDEAAAVEPNENSFTITYHFKDSKYSDASAVYTPFNNDYYTASSGEISGRLVNKRTVETVLGLLEEIK